MGGGALEAERRVVGSFWGEDMAGAGKDVGDLRAGHSLGSLRGLIACSSLEVQGLCVPLAHL